MAVTVETTSGRVAGVQEPDHQSFRGIPFAKPPLGELRFRAPVAAEPWSGERDASAFGPSAPQPPSLLPGMAVGEQSEDCLYLNVYTPAADRERRPVMVWIHGGGFRNGSGSQALYEAGRLTARGDVVVVTLNYRLGALGYLYTEGADANVGQLDQIAALEWVRDNIGAFGGDASNVTIFGESAGGMAVTTLLAMPAARGLFRRAIPQSGAAHHTHTAASASRVVEVLLDELGARDLDGARTAPVDHLIAAQDRCMLKVQREFNALTFAPVVDGASLPSHPLEAISNGAVRDIDLIVGTNRDEAKLFRMADPRASEMDDEVMHKRVRSILRLFDREAEAPRLIEAYRKAREGRASTEPLEIFDAIDSDRMFRIPAIRVLEAHAPHPARTYAYLFTWESPALRGALRACHALELPFVFGTLDAPTMDRFAGEGPDAETLSERMMDAWIAFARSGDPNHPGLPTWETYDADRRATLIFDREPELATAPLDEERIAWEGML